MWERKTSCGSGYPFPRLNSLVSTLLHYLIRKTNSSTKEESSLPAGATLCGRALQPPEVGLAESAATPTATVPAVTPWERTGVETLTQSQV